jgi:hypothetical protein
MELNIVEKEQEQEQEQELEQDNMFYNTFTDIENTYLIDEQDLAYYIHSQSYGGFNELYYDKNYTVGELKRIYDYYKLEGIKGLRKTDLIHSILMFEQDITNQTIVKRRHQLWSYLYELKQDSFMKRYVIF